MGTEENKRRQATNQSVSASGAVGAKEKMVGCFGEKICFQWGGADVRQLDFGKIRTAARPSFYTTSGTDGIRLPTKS
jgi:hypothetical protein